MTTLHGAGEKGIKEAMSNYGTDFVNTLHKNIALLETKLTTEDNHLTKSAKNNAYWCEVLRLTFADMNNIAGMLAMNASCDLSKIEPIR